MRLETDRLIITEFSPEMAESLQLNSQDEDNRRFVPDEVFETVEDAKKVMTYIMNCYEHGGPLVYPVLLKDGSNIGYVQAVPLEKGSWEIGYHIAKKYTGQGYATEAVSAFLPVIMRHLNIRKIQGISLSANRASIRVMENCGFTKEYEGQGFYQGKEREICRFTYCI